MTFTSSCHCGALSATVDEELPTQGMTCNCSICRRKGALWHPVADEDLRILTGEADLVLYQFNTKTAKHYFCRHCGIHPFARPRLDPSRWAFNVRCVDGLDLASLKIRAFDGDNWEATAKAYHDRLKR